MQYSLCIAVQCFTMQYSSVQCNTVQNNAVQFSTVQYSSVQCSKHCEVLSVHGRLDEVPPYSWLVLITSLEDISILGEDTWTLHCPLRHCTVRPCTALHCTALHCTALQCTALNCTVLHCTLCTAFPQLQKSPDTWLVGVGKLATNEGVITALYSYHCTV